MAKKDPMFDRIVDAANRHAERQRQEVEAKAAADRAAQDAERANKDI